MGRRVPGDRRLPAVSVRHAHAPLRPRRRDRDAPRRRPAVPADRPRWSTRTPTRRRRRPAFRLPRERVPGDRLRSRRSSADVVRPVREVLTALVFFAVAGLIARRMRRAATLGRRILAPVLVTALIRAITIAVYERARTGGEVTPAIESLGWLFALSPALLALAFAAGLLSARLYVATVLERLTRRLRATSPPASSRPRWRRARGPVAADRLRRDRRPGAVVDERAAPATAPRRAPGGRSSTVRVAGRARRSSTTSCSGSSPASSRRPPPTRSSCSSTSGWCATCSSLAARAVGVARAGRHRRRAGPAAHRARPPRRRPAAARRPARPARAGRASGCARARRTRRTRWRASRGIVDETIDEVRAIARGVYPSLLADRGLVEALRAAALGAPLGRAGRRRGRRSLRPRDRDDRLLRVRRGAPERDQARVRRDGHRDLLGRRRAAPLRGPRRRRRVRGRVARRRGLGPREPARPRRAVGGEVTIVSAPGHGTRVIGSVPTA